MLADFLAPKYVALYAFIACALFVHFRGHIRHPFYRQLTDHSTFMAPYNMLMYAFSAVPNRPFVDVGRFPEPRALTGNWRILREEALKIFDGEHIHIRAASGYNDLGFNSFFKRGWKRFYVKWYDEPLPSAGGTLPENRRARPVDTDRRRGDVRDAAGRRHARPPPRSVRGFAPLPPRPRDAQFGRLPDLRRRRAVHVARRGGGRLRRDVHALGREQDRQDARDPLLRRRTAASQPLRRAHQPVVQAHRDSRHRDRERARRSRRRAEQFFGVVYYLRMPGKLLKQRSRTLYRATKWILVAGLIYLLLLQ